VTARLFVLVLALLFGAGHAHVRKVRAGLLEHLDPLLGGEQPGARLGLVHTDGDHDLVEEVRGPGDDVDVPVGDRVEGSRANRFAHCVHTPVGHDRSPAVGS
jgi:hypothetical protein